MLPTGYKYFLCSDWELQTRLRWACPRPPNTAFLKTPFLDSGCHNSIKMDLVSSLMVICQTPSRPQSSGIRSLGKFRTGAPWDSSGNSYGGGADIPSRHAGASGCWRPFLLGRQSWAPWREWVLPWLCQGEAQVALIPKARLWMGSGSCRSWELRKVPSGGGGSCTSMHWHTHICFQLNVFGSCFIWPVASGLLHSPEDDGWRWRKVVELVNCGTAWLLVCVVWGFICCSFPSGLLHKHHMYYCQACSIKRTFMKGNIRGNIITGTL